MRAKRKEFPRAHLRVAAQLSAQNRSFAHLEAVVAIYHCSMKPIARAAGRSAVAAVAYRTASRLLNERDGLVHDFTGKRGVEHCEIVLPEGV